MRCACCTRRAPQVAHKRFGRKKFNLAQRKNRVAQKKATFLANLNAEE